MQNKGEKKQGDHIIHKRKRLLFPIITAAYDGRCVFRHRYQAVYNYLPRNEDELELKEGDVVDVMEKCDDGWFVGKKRKYRVLLVS